MIGVWQNMNISVLYDGKLYPQTIPTAATVGEVKFLLHERFDIPLERVELHLNRLPLSDALPDAMNMLDVFTHLNWKNGFCLYKKIRVWIKTNSGERYSLFVNEKHNVGRLKMMLNGKYGLDIMNKQLQFPENRVLDDGALLWIYEIREETELHLK